MIFLKIRVAKRLNMEISRCTAVSATYLSVAEPIICSKNKSCNPLIHLF